MKIYLAQIPPEGLLLEEDIPPEDLDLDTEIIKFREPVRVKAGIWKITNALTVELEINASLHCLCSRCAEEFATEVHKRLKFSYPVETTDRLVDLDPDIREELMLEYPVNPLCRQDCKGLCAGCGRNLNLERCSCSTDNNK